MTEIRVEWRFYPMAARPGDILIRRDCDGITRKDRVTAVSIAACTITVRPLRCSISFGRDYCLPPATALIWRRSHFGRFVYWLKCKFKREEPNATV